MIEIQFVVYSIKNAITIPPKNKRYGFFSTTYSMKFIYTLTNSVKRSFKF